MAGAHDRWRRIWEEQLDASPTDGHSTVPFFCAGMQVKPFFVSNITYIVRYVPIQTHENFLCAPAPVVGGFVELPLFFFFLLSGTCEMNTKEPPPLSTPNSIFRLR